MSPSPRTVTVGLDIGTTATKALAVEPSGEVIARSRVAHSARTPHPNMLEHDAAAAWRRGPKKAFDLVSRELSEGELRGVCVAGMVPSLAAIGPRGVPISEGLLYGDVRGRSSPTAGRDSAKEAPGPDSMGQEALPDAMGFLAHLVDLFPSARGYWPAQAVANYAIGGAPAIDSALAMCFDGLMSLGKWDPSLVERAGVAEKQLPSIVPMGEPAGKIRGSTAVIAGGTVDALCDQIVSGVQEPGDVLVICGATLVVWIVVSDWVEVPGLWTVPHTVGGRVLVGGPSNAGALFVDWARGLLERRSKDSVARNSRAGDPVGIPVWTPYVRGERAPFHDPTLRSGLHGLDLTQGPASLSRAAYEASGFVVRRMLEAAGVTGRRIVASGGGTRATGWMQAMADATGLPVDLVAVPEGAALGAAFLAGMAAGTQENMDEATSWARTGERIEPDPKWEKAAAARYARFVSAPLHRAADS